MSVLVVQGFEKVKKVQMIEMPSILSDNIVGEISHKNVYFFSEQYSKLGNKQEDFDLNKEAFGNLRKNSIMTVPSPASRSPKPSPMKLCSSKELSESKETSKIQKFSID